MAFVRLVVLLCVLINCQQSLQDDQKIFNGVADFVLRTLKMFGQSKAPVDDYTKSLPFMNNFEATKGFITDFKTAKRVGDATLEKKKTKNGKYSNQLMVNFRVQFDELMVKYESYKVTTFGKVSTSGMVGFVVKDAPMDLQVNIGKEPCILTVKKMEITSVGKVELKFYSSDGAEVPYGGAVKLAGDAMQADIKPEVEKILKADLTKIITASAEAPQATAVLQALSQSATCKAKLEFSKCPAKQR